MVFLFDLDGTLISSYMDTPNKDYTQWHLLPWRKQVIEKLVKQGHVIGIVTNQAGVGLGYITEQQVQERMTRVLHELHIPEAPWEACFAHKAARSAKYNNPKELARRKPSGVMIRELLRRYPDQASQGAIYVGDSPTDEQAARDAGVRFEYADSFFHHTYEETYSSFTSRS